MKSPDSSYFIFTVNTFAQIVMILKKDHCCVRLGFMAYQTLNVT